MFAYLVQLPEAILVGFDDPLVVVFEVVVDVVDVVVVVVLDVVVVPPDPAGATQTFCPICKSMEAMRNRNCR